MRTVQMLEKTNHPPTCLSTTDAICRRRAPSRRQVHCAPPSDRQPDCVRFHARTVSLCSSRKTQFIPSVVWFSNEFLPRISFSSLKSSCGVARGSMPPIGPSQPSSEVTLRFCTSLILPDKNSLRDNTTQPFHQALSLSIFFTLFGKLLLARFQSLRNLHHTESTFTRLS